MACAGLVFTIRHVQVTIDSIKISLISVFLFGWLSCWYDKQMIPADLMRIYKITFSKTATTPNDVSISVLFPLILVEKVSKLLRSRESTAGSKSLIVINP